MGKSSTLLQLPYLLGARYLPIFYNLQNPSIFANTPTFLGTIAEGIYNGMKARGLRIDRLAYGTLREARQINDAFAYSIFEKWLKDVESVLEREDRTLLLLFDEFEKLEDAGQGGYLNLPLLLDWFRSVIQYRARVVLLFSGVRTFGEMGANTGMNWASYFVNAQTLRVSFLKEPEARQLITQPVPGYPSEQIFGEGVVDTIIEVTGCHPFLVQAVCSALIDNLNATSREQAEIQDVRTAADQVLENWWDTYFRDLWERTNDEQRACLLAMRRLGNGELQEIVQQCRLNERIVRNTLHALLKRDLVLLEHGNYRIAAPLFGEWIERSSYNYPEISSAPPVKQPPVESPDELLGSSPSQPQIDSPGTLPPLVLPPARLQYTATGTLVDSPPAHRGFMFRANVGSTDPGPLSGSSPMQGAFPLPRQKPFGGLRILLIVLVLIFILGAGGGDVAAHLYLITRLQPVISITSNYHIGSTPAGSTSTVLRIRGSNFFGNSPITFLLDGSPVRGNRSVRSDVNGNVEADLTVTANWTVGHHMLTARDANDYITKGGVPVAIVPKGEANTPGPNGAPPDDTSFTVQATLHAQGARPYQKLDFTAETLTVMNGSVCRSVDDGTPHTQTTISNGVPYTETFVWSCSGTYKGGQLSYTQMATSHKIDFPNGRSCTVQKPYIYEQLRGTFINRNSIHGTLSAASITAHCNQGPSYYLDGTWTGLVTPSTLFFDNFADNSKGWAVGNDNGFSRNISNGRLVLVENNQNHVLPEPLPSNSTYSDFTVAATFTFNQGDQNDSVGIYMRGDSNLDHDYRVDINGDNSYAIAREYIDTNNTPKQHFIVSATPSSAIKPIGQQNTVTVIMKGSQLVLQINGTTVNSVSDTDYTNGQIALYVAHGTTSSGATAAFSSVAVYP